MTPDMMASATMTSMSVKPRSLRRGHRILRLLPGHGEITLEQVLALPVLVEPRVQHPEAEAPDVLRILVEVELLLGSGSGVARSEGRLAREVRGRRDGVLVLGLVHAA